MKIAFVYDAVYPYEKGGAQKRIWEIARRLADDHDVHYYGMKYWDGDDTMEREGVTFHGICPAYDLYDDGQRRISQALMFGIHTFSALRGESFDIIDCQGFPYFSVFPSRIHSELQDTEMVTTWYEVWDDYWYDYIGKLGLGGKIIEQMTIRASPHIIPISDHIKSDLEDVGRKGGMSVVPNGVDYDEIQEIDADPEKTDLVYLGRLAEHKQVEMLIEAAQKTGLSCKIIGDGPERERLEAMVDDGDDITFYGFVESDDEVIGHLKSASVFVLPSIREGFPNTILEANAAGTPAVVIDHPENGGRSIVEDGENGYVIDNDVSSVIAAIEKLVDDNLEDSSREFAQQYDWDVITDRIEAVYGDVQNE